MRNDDFLELVLSDDPDVATDLWIHWKGDKALTVLKDVQSAPARLHGVWHIPYLMAEGTHATANVEDARVRYFSIVERHVLRYDSEVSGETSGGDCLTCGSGEGACGCFCGPNPFIEEADTYVVPSREHSPEATNLDLHDPLCPRLGTPAGQGPAPDEYCACGLIEVVRRGKQAKSEEALRTDTSKGNKDDHHDLCICRRERQLCESCAPDYCACECVTLDTLARLDDLGELRPLPGPSSAADQTRLGDEFSASLDDFVNDLAREWGISRWYLDAIIAQGKSRLAQTALLAQVYAALPALYPGKAGGHWLVDPNLDAPFDGVSPLTYAVCRDSGLAEIVHYLHGRIVDAARLREDSHIGDVRESSRTASVDMPDPVVEFAVDMCATIQRDWDLADDAMAALLGISGNQWTGRDHTAFTDQQVRRASYLLAIWTALHQLYSGDLARQWMDIPNKNPLFAGETPVAFATENGDDGLARIRALLEGRLGRGALDGLNS